MHVERWHFWLERVSTVSCMSSGHRVVEKFSRGRITMYVVLPAVSRSLTRQLRVTIYSLTDSSARVIQNPKSHVGCKTMIAHYPIAG